MITVKFFAYYRDPEYANCKELRMEKCEDIFDLGNKLSDMFGEKFRNEFFSPDGQEIGERTILMINGRHVQFLGGIHAPIKDEDTVLVYPVVAGG